MRALLRLIEGGRSAPPGRIRDTVGELVTAAGLLHPEVRAIGPVAYGVGCPEAIQWVSGDSEDEEEEDDDEPEPVSQEDAYARLTQVAAYWEQGGAAALTRFVGMTYPEWARGDLEPGTPRPWLSLFALAACQGLGRRKPEQHRATLEALERSGLLGVLEEEDRDPPPRAALLEAVEAFYDAAIDRLQYEDALRILLPIWFVARRLGDYQALVEGAVDAERPEDVLAPRVSAAASGGGLDLPPLTALLGPMGSLFLLREIVRRRFGAEASALHPCCFVPGRQVRRFLGISDDGTRMNQSRQIWRLALEAGLPDPTFGHAFDIAIRMYMGRDRLGW